MRQVRLAALVSHPIQYQTPLFRALASCPDIELTVLFCSDWGTKPYKDEGFGQEFKWDIPLLDGYRSEFLPNMSPRPNVFRLLGLINPSIVRRLKKGRFDAVWVHGWSGSTNWLAILTAFSYGIPLLLRGETTLFPRIPPWKVLLKRSLLRQVFTRASAFLAIGSYNAEFYRAYGVPKEKIFLTPYAVNNDFFIARAEELCPRKNELKLKMGIPGNMPVILFAGKLSPVKRPMDLLQAFRQVSTTTRAALIYVGDGVERGELEACARAHSLDCVYFAGFKNQTELPQFYALADVLVLPSGFEPWGLVVNEAMCFSLPVIVSDQVGCRGDLVREGENGFVYPVGNLNKLAAQLSRILRDDQLRQKMGSASRSIIETWSYKEDVQAILTCLEKINA